MHRVGRPVLPRPRWVLFPGVALVLCSALSFILGIWWICSSSTRQAAILEAPRITPMHAALQAVFDDGLVAAGAEDYGSQHQGPLRPDGTINLIGNENSDGQVGGFRVHKRSPFGSGIDHTMDEGGLDFTELPEIKPATYVDPHAERGVQWSGALVQLMEQGYAREDAQVALSSTGNDLEASAKLLLQQRIAYSHGVLSGWFVGGEEKSIRTDRVAGVPLEAALPQQVSESSSTPPTNEDADERMHLSNIIVVDDEDDEDFRRRG